MKLFRPISSLYVCLSLCTGAFAGNGNALPHHPLDVLARPPHHVKAHATPSPTGYSVRQVKHAYGFDQIGGTGGGQIIAIVDAIGSPTLQADLNTFSATYGLPLTTLQIYYPQGAPPSASDDWALETTLDVEWAHAIAPNATIVVVVAKSASFLNLLDAVDYAVNLGAKQVSMSWGAPEFSSETSYDYHFNHPGVAFFASSGDKGAGVEWPAASPNVVSVGGTSIQLDGQGNLLAETAWTGSGGGTSVYEFRPAYQNGWQTNGGRGVPDVSYSADPNAGFSVYMQNYYGSTGWMTVGGTSAGTPQWAALNAIVSSAQGQPTGTWNTALYAKASTNYAQFYRDITSGNNGGFNATPAYDFVTGLGSPVASQFVPVAPSAAVSIATSGFETPDVGSYDFNAFTYDPATTASQAWTFQGNAGVTANGSGFTAANSPAPEGKQVGFLQTNNSAISQAVNFPVGGNYRLTLSTALRAQWNQGPQTVAVYLDSTYVGSFTPSGGAYEAVNLPFSTGAGSHVLSFHGTASVDATAFIDNVAVTAQ